MERRLYDLSNTNICVSDLASSNFAHTAGSGKVIWVKVSEGQFVKVKVTGRLAQVQKVKDGLDL